MISPMGWEGDEQYFLNKELALKKYKEKIEEYKKNDDVEDVREQKFVSSIDNNVIKEALVGIWEKTSYECDEWDVYVHSLILEEIETEE